MPAKRRLVSVKDRLPPKGQWVIAVMPSYRCMAYIDDKGKWREVNRGQQIQNVNAWSPLEESK